MATDSLSLPVTIEFQDATDGTGLPDEKEWTRWVGAALAAVEKSIEDGVELAGHITVRLVGDDESRHLNSTYRDKPGATNVLAFPGTQDGTPVPDEERELGDIVICLPVVYREAHDQGKQAVAHMAHMTIHGTLHLLGYDHEDDAAAGTMEEIETKILHRLGFPNPYTSV